MAKAKKSPNVDVKFLDGPKKGEKITVADPPITFMKLGMPEWAVYEYTGTGYAVKFSGDMARAWRNPLRSEFAPAVHDS